MNSETTVGDATNSTTGHEVRFCGIAGTIATVANTTTEVRAPTKTVLDVTRPTPAAVPIALGSTTETDIVRGEVRPVEYVQDGAARASSPVPACASAPRVARDR